MKKLCVIAGFLALVGCATTHIGPSVCDTPEAVGSWICGVAIKYNFEAEEMDTILLDATTIGLIAGAYDKAKAREVIKSLIRAVEEVQLSYTGLIKLAFAEAEKAQLVAQLLSRHLMLFDSAAFISDYDRGLIMTHLQRQMALVGE